MTALRHLVHLLRGRWFRRLFAVRVASQLTDGVFQVALASYVVFSPERQPGPGAIASALAVVLLPFSVLGPFVGVLLDRWSRRQVLAWSNFARVAMVLVLAVAVHADVRGPVLFGLILACLSVNRFLLAGLVRGAAARRGPRRPDDRQRAHPDRRDVRVPDRPRRRQPAPGSAGPRSTWTATSACWRSPRCCTAWRGRSRCASRATCSGRTSTRRAPRCARRSGTSPGGSSTGSGTSGRAVRRPTG